MEPELVQTDVIIAIGLLERGEVKTALNVLKRLSLRLKDELRAGQNSCLCCDTLFKLLSLDIPCPEIFLEEDGDICLDWNNGIIVSITQSGTVSWAALRHGHGTDLYELIDLLRRPTFSSPGHD